MNMLQISGHSFPDRPPNAMNRYTRLQRYTYIADALAFAALACNEVDRSLYKSIREVQAHALNLGQRAAADSPRMVQSQLAGIAGLTPFE